MCQQVGSFFIRTQEVGFVLAIPSHKSCSECKRRWSLFLLSNSYKRFIQFSRIRKFLTLPVFKKQVWRFEVYFLREYLVYNSSVMDGAAHPESLVESGTLQFFTVIISPACFSVADKNI
ncbi:hypothetical protein ATANTOWER_024432 [Ataeniobius toweri]|uniref:Uncharacterized protein n=1 Tax=Ataeniobius toweri TaxID=208326 RepID=A0ABU7AIX5_9TELE|nr:hypothetical protein [Ataeniobius toweri]